MLEKAESRLGYLRIVTPKERRGKAGKSHFVLRDGKLVDGTGSFHSGGALKTQIDPDDLARHHRLARRQHFLDRR